MTRKRQRLSIFLAGISALTVATFLTLSAFRENIVFFYSPTDLQTQKLPEGRRIRLGGLVEAGSVDRQGTEISFRVTDTQAHVPVHYRGLLPDLFREGQGVVAQGRLGPDGIFQADEILAKHDENYMPPEVADALKRAGTWQGRTQ